jgi:hypothetical protein
LHPHPVQNSSGSHSSSSPIPSVKFASYDPAHYF